MQKGKVMKKIASHVISNRVKMCEPKITNSQLSWMSTYIRGFGINSNSWCWPLEICWSHTGVEVTCSKVRNALTVWHSPRGWVKQHPNLSQTQLTLLWFYRSQQYCKTLPDSIFFLILRQCMAQEVSRVYFPWCFISLISLAISFTHCHNLLSGSGKTHTSISTFLILYSWLQIFLQIAPEKFQNH